MTVIIPTLRSVRDSLWSIAERYRANSGMEVRQYISD